LIDTSWILNISDYNKDIYIYVSDYNKDIYIYVSDYNKDIYILNISDYNRYVKWDHGFKCCLNL
jgi:hypothetical protein